MYFFPNRSSHMILWEHVLSRRFLLRSRTSKNIDHFGIVSIRFRLVELSRLVHVKFNLDLFKSFCRSFLVDFKQMKIFITFGIVKFENVEYYKPIRHILPRHGRKRDTYIFPPSIKLHPNDYVHEIWNRCFFAWAVWGQEWQTQRLTLYASLGPEKIKICKKVNGKPCRKEQFQNLDAVLTCL